MSDELGRKVTRLETELEIERERRKRILAAFDDEAARAARLDGLLEAAVKVEARDAAVRAFERTHIVNRRWKDPFQDPYEFTILLAARDKALDDLRSVLQAFPDGALIPSQVLPVAEPTPIGGARG